VKDPNLIVGTESSDDAGVYKIAPDLALVETTDVITPLVDDPYTFGRIAAANAISDIYAMGGKPLTAMNLLFCPSCLLPGAVLKEVLRGGLDAVSEAGVCLVGGHTVEDDELKYGLAVTGIISPEKVIRNNSSRIGDRLILTKPLGSGIISTAIKGEMADDKVITEASGWMTLLNRKASELMNGFKVNAATDITGFGFIGHSCEMASVKVTFSINNDSIPIMSGVKQFSAEGIIPAGCYRNRDFYASKIFTKRLLDDLIPLFDPQTSGGLLISIAPEDVAEFLRKAADESVFAVEVGEVLPRGEASVVIV